MTFYTPEILKSAFGGTYIVEPERIPEAPPPRFAGLSTDTRSIAPGQVFIALRGESHDAHEFVPRAVAAGAEMVVVDSPERIPGGAQSLRNAEGKPVFVMKVADTGKALLKLGASYRATLARTKVVAVAGSNGKTTTTRLIESVLSTSMTGVASKKSFNNAVGVPLTILTASVTDQFLICEVGTNAPGEIATLAEVVKPDVAVITSIGREHLEKLGSIEGVAREEASLLHSVKPRGLVVAPAPADCPPLAEHIKGVKNLVTFGKSPEAAVRMTSFRHTTIDGADGLEFVINGRLTCRVPLVGEHNAMNALAAYAVARRLGVEESKIVEGLAACRGAEMRLQRTRLGGIDVLNDAYNANPDSMAAGLRTLADLGASASRRVAVLGDMLELGAARDDSHRGIGRLIADIKTIDAAVLVGESMSLAAEELRRAGWGDTRLLHLPTLDAGGAEHAAAALRPGDLVLLKGSRRMRLERIVEALSARQPAGENGRPIASSTPYHTAPALSAT